MSNILKVLLRDLLPRNWQVPAKYLYGWLCGALEEEVKILGALVRSGDRVIDVGANRGIYAYQLWRLGARVEVFEPNPTCLRVLEAWAAGKPGVNVHSVALSDHAGSANLHIPVDASGIEHDASASIEHDGFAHARNQLVRLETLDSFEFVGVNLVKIDVEGHEYSVVEGAAVTLGSSTPALLVEIEQRHSSRPIAEVFAKILEFGYDGFFMRHGKLAPLEAFSEARDQASENFDKPAGRYINNFIFLHRDRLANGQYRSLMKGLRSP